MTYALVVAVESFEEHRQEISEADLTMLAETTRAVARHAHGEERGRVLELADNMEAALVAGEGDVHVTLVTLGVFRRLALLELAASQGGAASP